MEEPKALVPVKRPPVNLVNRAAQVGGVVAGGTLIFSTVIGVPVLVAVVGGAIALAMRQARRFVAENQLAGDALQRGDFSVAHDTWGYWAKANNPRIAVIARHNVASTWLAEGNLEAARRLFIDNSAHRLKHLQRNGLAKLGASSVAYLHGLLGDLDAAAKWCTAADQRTQSVQVPNADAMVILARTVVALRRGNADEAAKLLDDNWTLIEGRVTARGLRAFRLVRGLARTIGGPRAAGRGHEDLEALRPHYPGEHRYLATAWPEMAAFLATHSLDGP